MVTRSLNKKQTRLKIIESRRQGKTNQQIYFDLRTTSNERWEIAKLIVTTATDAAVGKHKYLRYILISLIVLSIPAFTYFLFKTRNEPYLGECMIILLYLAYVIYTCFHLYNGHSAMVIQPASITPIFMLSLFSNIESNVVFTSWMCYSILIPVLTFYLSYKTAPKGFEWGSYNLKKDDNGEYII